MKYESQGHIFEIIQVPCGTISPRYDVCQKSKKTGKTRIIGRELPFNFCLNLIREKVKIFEKSYRSRTS